MSESSKKNIVYFITACILVFYGWICGFIIGKSTGEMAAEERYNKLLDDYMMFSIRDHD